MPALNFCQGTYPRLVKIGEDSVCAITISQMKSINVTYVNLDACNEMRDTLKSIVGKQGFAIKAQQKLLTNKDEQLALSADMLKGQDIIILDYKKVYKRDQRQIKWLNIQRSTLAVAVIAFAAKVFLFH